MFQFHFQQSGPGFHSKEQIMSAHCEFTLFYPVFGTEREGCLFVKDLHTTQTRTLPHLHSQSLLDLPADEGDNESTRAHLDVLFQTQIRKCAALTDRMQDKFCLSNRKSLKQHVVCMNAFNWGAVRVRRIPQLLVRIQKPCDSAVFK